MNNLDTLNIEGKFTITHLNKDREIVGKYEFKNRIVTQGLTYIAKLLARQAPSMLYIGLYSGSYTPVATDTALTFPVSATEFTDYAELNRVLWSTVVPSTPLTTNSALRAEFTITANATVTGAFISTAPGKLATTGELFCAKGLPTSKPVTIGDILLVQYEVAVVNV